PWTSWPHITAYAADCPQGVTAASHFAGRFEQSVGRASRFVAGRSARTRSARGGPGPRPPTFLHSEADPTRPPRHQAAAAPVATPPRAPGDGRAPGRGRGPGRGRDGEGSATVTAMTAASEHQDPDAAP